MEINEEKIARFWKFFTENEEKLFNVQTGDEELISELYFCLTDIHPNLTFEMGNESGEHKEFTISADGIREAFPAVEALYDRRPASQRFHIMKFRQRKTGFYGIVFQELSLSLEDAWFYLEKDGDKLGINLYLKQYDAHDRRYNAAVFLLLDQLLGEYDMEVKAGFIELFSRETARDLEIKPISELPKTFDDAYAYYFAGK